MTKPGQRQRITIHRVGDAHRVSPDDIKARMNEVAARESADTRTEAQRWLGDPPLGRSALAQRKLMA
jgi:hypothetical protein